MAIGVWISLFAYFALMIAIGVYAMRRATSSSEDYMLGGRALSPKVAALSAGASDMSGWLLLGLPGALFASGLGSAWIGIGLLVGAFFNVLPGKPVPDTGAFAAYRVSHRHRYLLRGLHGIRPGCGRQAV